MTAHCCRRQAFQLGVMSQFPSQYRGARAPQRRGGPNLYQSWIVVRQNKESYEADNSYRTATTRTDDIVWDSETTYTLEFVAAEAAPMTAEDIERMRAATALYLQATTSEPLAGKKDYIAPFGPDLPLGELTGWLNKYQGHEPAFKVFSSQRTSDCTGVVRDRSCYGEVFHFNDGLTAVGTSN
ncbi:hypothetical protein BDV10DRAFT_185426 [Aspergillus recurvatus]